MIKIERMRMHLPTGFEHRATSIARLVGEALKKESVTQDISLEAVSLEPQRISVGTPDSEIAHLIVQQIVSNYRGGR